MERMTGAIARVSWRRLWAAVRPDTARHGPPGLDVVEPGALGEYAVLLQQRGPDEAAQAFPAVASHLAERCATCTADLEAVLAFLTEEQLQSVAARVRTAPGRSRPQNHTGQPHRRDSLLRTKSAP